jgi:hypothetical protein
MEITSGTPKGHQKFRKDGRKLQEKQIGARDDKDETQFCCSVSVGIV